MNSLNNSHRKTNVMISNATGTRDLVGSALQIRQKIISIVRSIFSTRDAIELDTPVVELRSVVDQLYGEEFNKQVYELADHKENDTVVPKEMLRYDLTVPLARYCAINGLKSIRRYQIGKVYRRDKPNSLAGRYREFYQCDFDIVGDDMGSGINDLEILEIMVATLDSLIGSTTYKIKINHRKFLVDVLLYLGISSDKISTVCSTIDKADKYTIEELSTELMSKGVSADQINGFKLVADLFQSGSSIENITFPHTDSATENSIKLLFSRLNAIGLADRFEFDPTLARGMDYYTGIIYEAVYLDRDIMASSIAAGGRYDGMISKLGTQDGIPAIGMSIGVERIARIIEQTKDNFSVENNPKVYVASIGSGPKVINERMKLCFDLRNVGINTATSNKTNPKMAAQFETVFDKKIKYMVIFGEREIDQNQIKIKDIDTKTEITFSRIDGIKFLQQQI